ncbi:hypothetical protein [Pseudoponticoccus marisrubri]|uniref:hypothetical protein n=1 Tax=Pseudoponticoccus marisrubri TaxID=1685382 RepID=UPI0014708592|nr:hypothetical protein [Pseudoponticoccus marisrubri]
MTLFDGLRTRMERRARYVRTVHELEALSHDTARDLNIAPGDARRIARQAVYG